MTLGAGEDLADFAPVSSSTALPGTPAAAALAAAAEKQQVGVALAVGSERTEQQAAATASSSAAPEAKQAALGEPGALQANEQEAADEGANSTEGPEFVAESGYRGLR